MTIIVYINDDSCQNRGYNNNLLFGREPGEPYFFKFILFYKMLQEKQIIKLF